VTVAAVLWDADGVLQDVPDGWEATMRPAVGHLVDDLDAFIAEAVEMERPALRGDDRWVEILPRLLERWGIPEAYDAALKVWLTIEPVEDARALVRQVRDGGVPCYLATNQDEHRGRFMHETLGYGDLLDGEFYSYELRAAKPEPAYFEAILARIRLPADEVLFVDDSSRNVEAARTVGLRAEHWHSSHGAASLRALLAGHGLPLPPVESSVRTG